ASGCGPGRARTASRTRWREPHETRASLHPGTARARRRRRLRVPADRAHLPSPEPGGAAGRQGGHGLEAGRAAGSDGAGRVVGGRVRRTVESNRESAQASAGDLAAMLLSEQATLAQSYFQLRVTDLDLGLLERSMAAYEKALEVTRNRYQAGVAQRYDVTQAQTQLENVRAQHVDLGITRATLEHAIAVLVGRPPAALSIPRKEQAPAIPAIPLTLPSQLLERRPDIAAAERRAAAANAQIGI